MSKITDSYSRKELYELYKKEDPKLAGRFLERDYFLLGAGSICSGMGLTTAIFSLALLGATGILFQNPAVVCAVVGSVSGAIIVPGLATIGVWYIRSRIKQAERLSGEEINRIAREVIVNKFDGFDQL